MNVYAFSYSKDLIFIWGEEITKEINIENKSTDDGGKKTLTYSVSNRTYIYSINTIANLMKNGRNKTWLKYNK